MKAVRYHEKGPPGVLRLEEVDPPLPAAGDLAVRIHVAGVGYGDVLRRSGRYYPQPTPLPFIPGATVAGVVEAVGADVDPAWIGCRVRGNVTSGAYAEQGVGPAWFFQKIPDDISFRDAVTSLADGLIAFTIFATVGRLHANESVFVPAGGSGVGHVAIQAAKQLGARMVIAAAGSPAKRQVAREAGADVVIDYGEEHWSRQVIAENGGAGVDLALEMVGGSVLHQTLECVRPGGRVVNFGNASDTEALVNPRLLLRKNLTISGFTFRHFAADCADIYERVTELVRSGKVRQRYTEYSLDAAASAHEAIESRSAVGRQIIVIR